MITYKNALVVGAGAFGTSLASILADRFEKVVLKVRSKDVYDAINNDRENSVYLKGIKLKENIQAVLEWDELDKDFDQDIQLLVSGLPTAGIKPFFEENFDRFEKYFQRGIPLISLSKGIDSETLELSDDLFFDYFPHYRDLITFLSGPSFAKEIMQEQWKIH